MHQWKGPAAAAILFALALLAIPLAQYRGEYGIGVQTYAGQHDNAAPCEAALNAQGQTASKNSCAGQSPAHHPDEGIKWTDIVVAISAIGNLLVAAAIAIFTGFLWNTSKAQHGALLASVAEAAKAATAAKASADAIPVLERAYVYSIIESENISEAIRLSKNALPRPNNGPFVVVEAGDTFAWANIMFQNFGKTPARLVNGEIKFSMIPPTLDVFETTDWPIKYNHVLGQGDKTEPFTVKFPRDFTMAEAVDLEAGERSLVMWGQLTYLDIWDVSQVCPVSWSYNCKLNRLTPNERYPIKQEG